MKILRKLRYALVKIIIGHKYILKTAVSPVENRISKHSPVILAVITKVFVISTNNAFRTRSTSLASTLVPSSVVIFLVC